MLRNTTGDRGSVFTSNFGQVYAFYLGARRRLSTAFRMGRKTRLSNITCAALLTLSKMTGHAGCLSRNSHTIVLFTPPLM